MKGTFGAANSGGEVVDAWVATIVNFAADTTLYDVVTTTACALLLLLVASLTVEYLRLRKRHAAAEAQLVERAVGKDSTNWANTADNLERKAKDPGDVARSTAMTHLHMLDEAANAWLKGSQWLEALRVTQECLSEACHTIGKPSLHESELRAAADLVERRLATYADLSKAAGEARETAQHFLDGLDRILSVLAHRPRVLPLREQIAAVRAEVELKDGEKPKAIA